MASNQSDRQASVRAVTGTALSYEGDWHALFDLVGIAKGDFDGRLLQWINLRLGTSYTNLPGAMFALGLFFGARSWDQLGTFTASIGPPTGDGKLAFNRNPGTTTGLLALLEDI